MEVLSMKNLSSGVLILIFIFILIFIIYLSKKIIEKKKINTFLENFPSIKTSVRIFPLYFTRIRIILYTLFLLFAVLSLLNPSFEEEKATDNTDLKGVDIVFLVDVSLSMNAEEVGITRLSRFKEAILSVLPSLAGNRFGIITFAGTSFLYCPMTSDQGAFSDYVRGIETDMIPDTGTNIKKAFEKADELLKSSKVYRNRIVVLATDGEDTRESIPSDIPASLIVLGIGDTDGSFIRYKDETTGLSGFVTKEGKLSGNPSDPLLIKSALNDEYLKKIANKMGGEFINLNTNPGGADAIISKVGEMDKNSETILKDISRRDGYQYLLFPALVFLLMDIMILEIYGNKAG
jgi:Ca-activated chloride channel family protein